MTMGLLPSLWVSWQAPVARGVVLPALAILMLALLLPREEDGWQRTEPTSKARKRHRGTNASGSRSFLLTSLGSALGCLGRALLALVIYPALLYLLWGAICAARAGTLPGAASSPGGQPLPGAADFARGELIRLTAGVALYMTLATTARNWQRARQMVDAFLGAVVGATVVAFLTHRAEDPALIGPFGNAQLLAAVLLLLTPLAVVVATGARNRRRRTAAQVAMVLGLAALALTQTRSAWLGGLAALLVLAGLLSRLPRRRRRRWNRQPPLHSPKGSGVGAPALVSGALALAALGWLVCHTDLSGPITARAATLTRLSDDEGTAWRLRQWQAALGLARERPLAGHGLGSFPLAVAPRLPQPIPLAVARAVGPNLSLNAHNFYLQSLVETGAVGLGLYLWTLVTFFYAGLRACRRRGHRFRALILVACMAGIAGQAVDALANPAYQFMDSSFFFWALLGLGTAMAQHPPRLPVPRLDDGGATPGPTFAVEQSAHEESPPAIDPHSLRPVPYPLRLAAVLAGAAVLAASSVAGAPPPLNQPSYLPLRAFRVAALTTPGYLTQTLLPGECVEMRGLGTLYSGDEEDATAQTTFSRAGGTAPADCLQQFPTPHANLFRVPTGLPASYDGLTVSLQGTFDFNGQTLTALGPLLTLSVPRAAPGVQVTAEPQAISPTGEMVMIQVHYTEADMRFQRLQKVEANEPLAADDVQILDDTHVMLRATSTVPDQRIYTLRYRFRDRRNRTWMAPVQIYVR
jgi:O-antigen ligase